MPKKGAKLGVRFSACDDMAAGGSAQLQKATDARGDRRRRWFLVMQPQTVDVMCRARVKDGGPGPMLCYAMHAKRTASGQTPAPSTLRSWSGSAAHPGSGHYTPPGEPTTPHPALLLVHAAPFAYHRIASLLCALCLVCTPPRWARESRCPGHRLDTSTPRDPACLLAESRP